MRKNYHCFFKCDICGREFPTEHAVRAHVMHHRNDVTIVELTLVYAPKLADIFDDAPSAEPSFEWTFHRNDKRVMKGEAKGLIEKGIAEFGSLQQLPWRFTVHCEHKDVYAATHRLTEHVKRVRADLLKGIGPAITRTIAKWSE